MRFAPSQDMIRQSVMVLLSIVAFGCSSKKMNPPRTQRPTPTRYAYHNDSLPFDVDESGTVEIYDILLVVRDIRNHGTRRFNPFEKPKHLVDVDGDGYVSIGDILGVVMALREQNNNPNMDLSMFLDDSTRSDLYAAMARALDRDYGFYDPTDGHYHFNFSGFYQEKWLRGTGENRYVIFPDGVLYYVDEDTSQATLVLAKFPREYYEDPSLIHEASDGGAN